MTDGKSFDIFHPDLLLVGMQAAVVGLTGEPGQTFFERTVKVDLWHVIRIEPIETPARRPSNGPQQPPPMT
jgi:hypothetical protein